MVNEYFKYKDIELWNAELWKDHISRTFPLVSWMKSSESTIGAL